MDRVTVWSVDVTEMFKVVVFLLGSRLTFISQ